MSASRRQRMVTGAGSINDSAHFDARLAPPWSHITAQHGPATAAAGALSSVDGHCLATAEEVL
jgi:hypothetical protein